MRLSYPALLLVVAACCALGPRGMADPPRQAEGASIPVAGPAPTGDYLPPVDPEAREQAATGMLIVVVVALVVIVVLLRWTTEGKAKSASPEQDLVARASRALEEAEGSRGGRPGD